MAGSRSGGSAHFRAQTPQTIGMCRFPRLHKGSPTSQLWCWLKSGCQEETQDVLFSGVLELNHPVGLEVLWLGFRDKPHLQKETASIQRLVGLRGGNRF
jgi:hypothetical protein